MVRLFHVYYPVRTLILLAGEAVIVCLSFLLATVIRFGPDSYLFLNYEQGLYKIAGITVLVLLCSYYSDLYAPQMLSSRGETYFRVFLVLGISSFCLALLTKYVPGFLARGHVYSLGLIILTCCLLLSRKTYLYLVSHPALSERVFVLGSGERATRLIQAIRTRKDLGMEVAGWAGELGSAQESRDALAKSVSSLIDKTPVHRLIVAVSDRRNTLPVREILDLRLSGIKIEESTALMEKVQGKIEVDTLHPSSLIFSDGFRLSAGFMFVRRVMSLLIAATVLLIFLPAFPLIAFAIRLNSPGPILFRQRRVGKHGRAFFLYKFRTMRQDAEAATGAVWAEKDDPRITRIGRFLRKTRLDELPQLWNVLIGDMGFVGPRPERPEFVEWLSEQIPYYNLRHIIRPGLTGWAQVRYRYGASVDDAKEKLHYDLYYIKHISLTLDLLIIFETLKTVLFRRGAQ